jgi:hypothetical protein
MSQNLDDYRNIQTRGILQTGSKQNGSKQRRISWGEVKVKEFTKNDEVNAKAGEEYNIALTHFIIQEEPLNECDRTTHSLNSNDVVMANASAEVKNLAQNTGQNNLNDFPFQSMNMNIPPPKFSNQNQNHLAENKVNYYGNNVLSSNNAEIKQDYSNVNNNLNNKKRSKYNHHLLKIKLQFSY